MRKRFDQQLKIGQIPIEETRINSKSKNAINELFAALKELYCNKKYNEEIFQVLEKHINTGKQKTGRPGLSLWSIFVLSQVRLCLNLSYDSLHDLANNHSTMRQLMGIETEFGFEKKYFEYQNIYDNVSLLTDDLIKEINSIVLDFGHKEVFKKKEKTALRLKTDSFVVECNVHFPCDYNLLWDCMRKCLDSILKLQEHNDLKGWRKIGNWRYSLKGLMRELGKANSSGGKNKAERVKKSAERYLVKSKALLHKLNLEFNNFEFDRVADIYTVITLEYYMELMVKHIDLVERRMIKGEIIPHEEKMFSVFETYTEWIKKGKSRPNVELGKKLSITTDQFNLIVDHQIMTNQQDRDIVISTADRLIEKYKISSWSFDKGYWRKENKEILQLVIPKVVMPKLGKRNKSEEEEEKSRSFKKIKNQHSAIESNINELEHRGLDRCPDRSFENFIKYSSLAVCAYNLKKIGRKILETKRKTALTNKKEFTQAA